MAIEVDCSEGPPRNLTLCRLRRSAGPGPVRRGPQGSKNRLSRSH